MRKLAAALMLLTLAASGTAPADEAKIEGDLKAIQGKWSTLVGPEKNVPIVLEIKNTKVTLTIATPANGDFVLSGEIKLDESKKPKQMDWSKFSTPDGQQLPTMLGIYELKADGKESANDELKVCNAAPDADRPTEFKGGDGPGATAVYKRVKEEKKADDAAKDKK